jgi:hypothetical protein
VVADSTTQERVADRAPDPHADLSIIMTEYSYQLSGPVSAGRHLIRVENRGAQPHEADLIRLGPGKTPHDYIAWLDGGEQGLPPAEVAGGVGDFVAGRTVVDGRHPAARPLFHYLPVPDAGDGKPHYDHGMIREFEVR